MRRNQTFLFIVIAVIIFSSTSVIAAARSESLTLEQALSLALSRNPELSASLSEIQAREAEVVQARSFPNPEIEIRTEGIYGNKERTGFSGAESSFSLGQPIELGGKRSKRTRLAALYRDLAKWDLESKRLDVVLEVTKSFIDVLLEQERVRLQEELARVAEQSLIAVSARVQAGKVSPIDETRASSALALVKIDLERARRSLDSARKRLSAFLDDTFPILFTAEGTLDLASPLPEYRELQKRIHASPDIARWKDESEQRVAALVLEKAKQIPDPIITGGVKRFSENQENTFIAGISLPLPIFNTNKGAVQAAQNRLVKSQEEKKAAVLKAQTTLADAYLTLSSSFAEATSLKTDVIPSLKNAHDAIEEGYRFGKFGYIDVLDAQRGLFEAKIKYIDSLATYQKALAGIERLMGTSLRDGREGKEK
jgi:cobalt-zinc-cadmium efflux system outer membrane protein